MKLFKCPECGRESNSVSTVQPASAYGNYWINDDEIDYDHQEFEYGDGPIEFSCYYCDYVLPGLSTEEELKEYWENQR